MKIGFTWDDGALEDLKMFELHEKYEIPGMFFIPNVNCEGRKVLSDKMIVEANRKLLSFGGHTVSHRYLTEISNVMVEQEIRGNKQHLEMLLNHPIKHFCLPGGAYNRRILDISFRLYDTVRTTDTMNFKKKERVCKPTFHFYPRGLKSLIGNAMRNGSYSEMVKALQWRHYQYSDILKMFIDYHAEDDVYIIIWGHSWEIEEMGHWVFLEDLFRFISGSHKEKCVTYEKLFSEEA